MSGRNFMELLKAQWAKGNFVCVGLDSEYAKIPLSVRDTLSVKRTICGFNGAIVDATKDLVCAYKPNIAFYSAQGLPGLEALRMTISYIHAVAPEVPMILDAKRADIGNTNAGYVAEAFDEFQSDAVTVHPYLGQEALRPFLDCADKGVIVLCRTSNSGAGEFQDLPVQTDWSPDGAVPLYEYVAMKVAKDWNEKGNCALVVGATYPAELEKVRGLVGDLPILIPGVGFQQKGVSLETQVDQMVAAGQDSHGQGMIINSSRGIIFASSGEDFAEAARRETEKFHTLINKYRNQINLPLAESPNTTPSA